MDRMVEHLHKICSVRLLLMRDSGQSLSPDALGNVKTIRTGTGNWLWPTVPPQDGTGVLVVSGQ